MPIALAIGAAIALAGCGKLADDTFCAKAGCGWSADDWSRLSALGGLPAAPPPDSSNVYVGNPAAETLGQKWFFDVRFAGTATLVDQLKRPVPYARAAKGQALAVSCATCHDLGNGGIDDSSVPGNVSVGAGWFDVNAQPALNAGFYDLPFWNGRTDSLWAQAVAATEGGVSMNSSRLQVAWVISDLYRTDYSNVFTTSPLPMSGPSSAVAAMVGTNGQCTPVNGDCPTSAGCRTVADPNGGAASCWPRFPLQGKPGNKTGCQAGDATEPFNDAWDCMDADDQTAVNRVFVAYGKAIAAYEAKLVSRNSAFDQFVAAGPDSGLLSPAAVRGARLFVGRAACSDCHNTPLFSDNQFHDIGAPQVGGGVPTEAECPAGGVCDCVEAPATTAADGTPVPEKDAKNCLPWGGRDGLAKLQKNTFRRDSVWSDNPTDASRKKYINPFFAGTIPKGAWRTPTLRDIALTAPYMHDGVFATLGEVIDHYNQGVANSDAVGVPAPQLRPLFLSDDDKSDLIEFLTSLTGELLPVALRTAPVLP